MCLGLSALSADPAGSTIKATLLTIRAPELGFSQTLDRGRRSPLKYGDNPCWQYRFVAERLLVGKGQSPFSTSCWTVRDTLRGKDMGHDHGS
jgi:hypothetical protein